MSFFKKNPIPSGILLVVIVIIIRLARSANQSAQKDTILLTQVEKYILPDIQQLEQGFTQLGSAADEQNMNNMVVTLTQIESNLADLKNHMPAYEGDDANLIEWLSLLNTALDKLSLHIPPMKALIMKAQKWTFTPADEAELNTHTTEIEDAGSILERAGDAFGRYAE